MERRRFREAGAVRAALVAAALLASIADPAGAQVDADSIARRLPRVEYQGGPFLRHPRIVTITFATDDTQLVSRLVRFGDTIARTSWWRAVTDGYCAAAGDCIGDGQPGRALVLDEALPAHVRAVDVSARLTHYARAGTLGPLDPDTLLLVYLPPGVGLSDAFVRYCDGGPRAYHRMLRFDDTRVPFAVIPRCADEASLTATASHELLEIATNPDLARPGFAFQGGSTMLGFTAAGTEPMDPCGLLEAPRSIESGFVVQRAWSNRAASLGRDPCVPAPPDRPFVALVPEEPTVRLGGGASRVVVPLVALANRPVSSWTVSAAVRPGSADREPCVAATLDRTVVGPGQPASLMVTRRAADPPRLCVVSLVSKVDEETYAWPLAILLR